MAIRSPIAVQGTKHVLNYSRDHSVAEGLTHIAEWNSVMLQTEDLVQSVQAAMTKTTFKDIDFEKL